MEVSATPGTGYVFANWSTTSAAIVDDAEAESTYVTITGAATVTAHFSLYTTDVGHLSYKSSHAETPTVLYHRSITRTATNKSFLSVDVFVDLAYEPINSSTVFSIDFGDGVYHLTKTMKDAGSNFRHTPGIGGYAILKERQLDQRVISATLRWSSSRMRVSLTVTPPPGTTVTPNFLDLYDDVYQQGDEKGTVRLEGSTTCTVTFGNYRWISDAAEYKGKGKSLFSQTIMDDLVSWDVNGGGPLDQTVMNL